MRFFAWDDLGQNGTDTGCSSIRTLVYLGAGNRPDFAPSMGQGNVRSGSLVNGFA